MAKTQQFCFRHPDRLTYRKCYVCKKPICRECQVHRSHHYFCSINCWMTFWLEEWRGRLFSSLRAGKRLILPWGAFALSAFLLALWGTSWFHLKGQVAALRNEVETLKRLSASRSQPSAAFKITKPAEVQGMVRRSILQIEGEAADNSVVMLLADGKLVAVQKPDNNRFIFKNVRLNRGLNHLLVQMMTPEGERLALQALTLRYNVPSYGYLARPFDRGSVRERTLALTFDGGAEDNVSGEILDFLREYNVRATFFLTGEFVLRFPETVRRIVAEGHEVGNHTMHHPHLTTYAENRRHDTRPDLTKERFQNELKQMAAAFEKVTGKKIAPLWRPPYGEHNREIRSWAAELGYREVGWTVGTHNGETMDTRDWVAKPSDPGYRTADEILKAILQFADEKPSGANGAIILMHLGSHRQKDFPHRKLPEIIEGLRSRGYHLVTVSELMQQ